eukprot:scaffold370826_cov20-Prasinocladus_malaysianus.AAC.1
MATAVRFRKLNTTGLQLLTTQGLRGLLGWFVHTTMHNMTYPPVLPHKDVPEILSHKSRHETCW